MVYSYSTLCLEGKKSVRISQNDKYINYLITNTAGYSTSPVNRRGLEVV